MVSIHGVSALSFTVADEHDNDPKSGIYPAGKIAGKLKKLFAYQAYDSSIMYNTLGQEAVISPGKTLLRCHIDQKRDPEFSGRS